MSGALDRIGPAPETRNLNFRTVVLGLTPLRDCYRTIVQRRINDQIIYSALNCEGVD